MASCLSAPDPTLSLSQLLVLLLVTVSFCMVKGQGSREGEQREFDYFALALQWPGTYCQRTRHCCSSNPCCRRSNAPTEFTIHGLWPDYNDGRWPSCCRGTIFNEKEISSLKGALAKYWPSLSCGSSSTCHGTRGSFWAHEWEKHGTCAFPVIGDEYSYFLTAIKLYSKYNISRVLFEEGYVPSNTEKYPLGGIVSAIENAFHATPKVSCSKDAVEELQICFYKDFKPRDCVIRSATEGYLNSSSSCPNYVSLPTYVSLGLNDADTATSWVPENEAF